MAQRPTRTPALAAWLRGPLRDALWFTLGAALVLALSSSLLTVLAPAGTSLTPRSLVPPAAAPGAVPAVPTLTAPSDGDRG